MRSTPRPSFRPNLPKRRPVTDSVATPHRIVMGLAPLAADECWLELDEDLGAYLATKKALLVEQREQVFVELPASRPGQRAILDHVVQTLLESHPAHFERRGRQLHILETGAAIDLADEATPPLIRAALCVQEDLVLMQRSDAGWCLTAAVVCFPTRWDLPTQLGRPMTAIHGRVPGYVEQLDDSANRFFDGMKAGAVFRRANWSLLDDPALFQPSGHGRADENAALNAKNAGEKIWLRVEHQTLQRIEADTEDATGILFGIRVHRTRLAEVVHARSDARALIGAIETMSPEMQLYKSMSRVRRPALAYLEEHSR